MNDEPTTEEYVASVDALRAIEALANEDADASAIVDEVFDLYEGRESDLAEGAISAAAVILKHVQPREAVATLLENTRNLLLSRGF